MLIYHIYQKYKTTTFITDKDVGILVDLSSETSAAHFLLDRY